MSLLFKVSGAFGLSAQDDKMVRSDSGDWRYLLERSWDFGSAIPLLDFLCKGKEKIAISK